VNCLHIYQSVLTHIKVSVLHNSGSKMLWKFHTGQKLQTKSIYCNYF